MKLETKLEQVYTLVLSREEALLLANIIGARKPDPTVTPHNVFATELYDTLWNAYVIGDQK